jgi:hypothetical protein
LAEQLRAAQERGVNVVVGTVDEALRARVRDSLPDVEAFVSELGWLSRSPTPSDDTEISRLLLADREAILVSSFTGTRGDGREHEQGVFGRGFDNDLVTVVRRLMAMGLLGKEDPGGGDA